MAMCLVAAEAAHLPKQTRQHTHTISFGRPPKSHKYFPPQLLDGVGLCTDFSTQHKTNILQHYWIWWLMDMVGLSRVELHRKSGIIAIDICPIDTVLHYVDHVNIYVLHTFIDILGTTNNYKNNWATERKLTSNVINFPLSTIAVLRLLDYTRHTKQYDHDQSNSKAIYNGVCPVQKCVPTRSIQSIFTFIYYWHRSLDRIQLQYNCSDYIKSASQSHIDHDQYYNNRRGKGIIISIFTSYWRSHWSQLTQD